MSRPVEVSAVEVEVLHQLLGIWKSPVNTPVAGPDSTRVNPVAPSPESVAAAPVVAQLP